MSTHDLETWRLAQETIAGMRDLADNAEIRGWPELAQELRDAADTADHAYGDVGKPEEPPKAARREIKTYPEMVCSLCETPCWKKPSTDCIGERLRQLFAKARNPNPTKETPR